MFNQHLESSYLCRLMIANIGRNILSGVPVTTHSVWFGNRFYLTLAERNYN
jgi:hypothetical protein